MPADSTIRVWRSSEDYVTLDYAQARLSYSQPGERIRDRLGLIHRIVPQASYTRYPVRLSLSVLAEELLRDCSAQSSYACVLDWLTAWFRAQANLAVFVRGDSLAMGGADVSRNLALLCYIEEMPQEYSGTLPVVGGGPEYVEIAFHVYEDGTFTDFNSLSSYEEFTPARPGE